MVHIGAFTFTFESADQLDLKPFDEAPVRRSGIRGDGRDDADGDETRDGS